MTDLEMTRLCAAAMGVSETVHYDERAPKPTPPSILVGHPHSYDIYDPLHDDAQAMELVKKFQMDIKRLFAFEKANSRWEVTATIAAWDATQSTDLNRAIVECVAKCQEKYPNGSAR